MKESFISNQARRVSGVGVLGVVGEIQLCAKRGLGKFEC